MEKIEGDALSIFRLKRTDIPFILTLYAVSFLFFTLFSYFFFQSDFFHLRILSYAEKARLAVEGSPPRLENVGFVYPPLPVLMAILFRHPWLLQGVVSSFVYTVILYLGFKFYRDDVPVFAALPLFVPFLYLALLRFDVLLFFFLVAMSTYLLLKYWESSFSLYLFLGGILFGLSFFVDFSAIYLVFIYGIFLLLKKETSFSKKSGIALVFLLPALFFFGFTLFINYVFKGDPFYFLNRYFELYQDPLVVQARSDFFTALALVFEFLNLTFLLILPYLIGFILIKDWRGFYFSPFFLIYIAPIFLIFLQIRAGTFSFSLSNSVIFIFFLLLFMNRMRLRWPVYLALAVSFVSAPFLFLSSPDANEVNFARAILGRDFERNLTFFREVAREIDRLEGQVVLDDKSLYPAVFLVSDVSRLILPYQYHFYGILANPCPQVDYAVGVLSSEDAVYRLYPEMASLKLDGCKFYGRVGNAIFFSCSPPCYSDTYLY